MLSHLKTNSPAGIVAIISPAKAWLRSELVMGQPNLSQLATEGLPAAVTWGNPTGGPEFSFAFSSLEQGVIPYDPTALPEPARPCFSLIREMLAIGSYSYSFQGVCIRTDVCIHSSNGGLWIIDTHNGSLVATAAGSVDEWERLAIRVEFLNSQVLTFNKCV